MGSIDQNNSSVLPLNAGQSFIGVFTSSTDYSELCISVETNSKFTLTISFSSDANFVGYNKIYTENAISLSAFTYQVQPYQRYYYITLTNTDTINQSYLRLQTILKNNVIYSETGGSGPASNVNIINPLNGSGYVEMVDMNNHYDGSGNLLVAGNLSLSGNVNANITGPLDMVGNVLVSDTATHAITQNIYNIVSIRGKSQINNGSIGAGGLTNSVNLSNIPVRNLTFYGQSSDAATIFVMFSPDNTTFLKSQYCITVGTNEPFGFSLQACPSYVALRSDTFINNFVAVLEWC